MSIAITAIGHGMFLSIKMAPTPPARQTTDPTESDIKYFNLMKAWAENEDINFYAKQTRTALANCGEINAENIDEAIAVRGYEALAKVLSEGNPDGVIDEIVKSGLRGRSSTLECCQLSSVFDFSLW